MRLFPLCSLALLLPVAVTTSVAAQTPAPAKTFSDPANLRGERIKLIDGRELPVDKGTSGLQQMLRRLNTRASILNIVAHPDDEDGGMLTFYSRGQGARVADLSLNRGEGGQNAMTGDFEDALGLIRTQELLASDRYSGIDQFFGTEVDFGFSKTKEEAFAKWTHERVLYDVVRAVRIYRPLVLTATFIGGVTDGHGHHQVSGQIAQEVFKAAADPTIFPELTAEGILPWQPLKVYARAPMQAISDKGLFDYATNQYIPARFVNYVTGQVSTTPPQPNVVVHEGDADPLLAGADGKPMSYVQFARMGLGMQKSQIGPGLRVPPAGKFDVAYHRYASMLPADKQKDQESSFFDGIDTSLEGIAALAPGALPSGAMSRANQSIESATKHFDASHPEAIAPELASALKEIDLAIQHADSWNGDAIQKENVLHELRVKRAQLSEALALALNVQVRAQLAADRNDALVDHPVKLSSDITPAQDIELQVRITATPSKALRLLSYDVDTTFHSHAHANIFSPGDDKRPGMPFPHEGDYEHGARINVPASAKPTMPYFYRKSIEQPFYDLSDPELRNAPATPPIVTATFHLSYDGADFDVTAPALGVHTYADGSTSIQPMQIVPPISIASAPLATVLPLGTPTLSITTTLRTALSTTAKVSFDTPPSWTLDPPPAPTMVHGDQSTIEFTAHPPASFSSEQLFHISAKTPDNHEYTESYRGIGYAGLPATNAYTPATTRIVPVRLKLPAKHRIGYLPGTGDAVPEALASIGLTPQMLTVADLTTDKLKQFDTVILGVRTYAAHPDLHGAPTQALLDYARNGGNVVVQYQTAEFTADDAPYPLSLGRDAERVVDENDPVQLLAPATTTRSRSSAAGRTASKKTAPNSSYDLLTAPNRLTSADFNGWVEERGHGFLRTWDAHYTALTETHDPGAPAEGVQPEEPQKGGLVTTQLGSGRWTYLAFAVYRQLPEAVPGAYRLFVNLLQK
jgi:LmbE family N-acetylglucosaminyl deacetylase